MGWENVKDIYKQVVTSISVYSKMYMESVHHHLIKFPTGTDIKIYQDAIFTKITDFLESIPQILTN